MYTFFFIDNSVVNHIHYGVRLPPIPYGGGAIMPPLPKMPEFWRMELKLSTVTKCGLKFRINPNLPTRFKFLVN